MSCYNCNDKPTLNIILQNFFNEARRIAIINNWKTYAIVERVNGSGYIVVSDRDERCRRLKVIGYYTIS